MGRGGRIVAVAMGWVFFVAGLALGQGPVHLIGWTDAPILLPRAGAGVELFRLWAEVRWEGAAAANAGRLSKRVVGPSGQTMTEPIDPEDFASGRRIAVHVPAAWVRNLRPEAVQIELTVVDSATDPVVAGPLLGDVDAFPRPKTATPPDDPGPFGWGRPLDGPPDSARAMSREGPDGWRFVRVPASKDVAGFFLATTEASNRQVQTRLSGYDPRAGRSDEFLLEAPDQPAIGLSPAACLDYLKALQAADPGGPRYRLPTRTEWLFASGGGQKEAFSVSHGNFHGDELTFKGETTASVRPASDPPAFRPNPWGFFHMVGNVEEWTTDPSGGFVRLFGHFRTEVGFLPEPKASDARTVGPDPYVGLRPAFSLAAEPATAAIKKALAAEPRLAGVTVTFDPHRLVATLGGTVAEAGDRRRADERIKGFWWVEAVDNRIEDSRLAQGQLARLGHVAGPARVVAPLGRTHYEVPLSVTWSNRLPVVGSEWWVNVDLPGGGHESHRMVEGGPDATGRAVVVVDRAKLPGALAGGEVVMNVSLSLGAAATSADDARVASNVATVRWKVP